MIRAAILFFLAAVAAADECMMACPMNYLPLCGVDGQTYSNQCHLQSVSCSQKKTIAVAHAGECTQQEAIPVCNVACTLNYLPVCGTDGHTYGNECELESIACVQKKAIAIAHAGECTQQAACNIACTLNYLPVCGTDGHTYGNECELESTACLQKKAIAVAYSGECRQQAVEVCNVACTFNYLPVCGTDGQTYGNQCELESTACLRKSGVTVAYQHECLTESVIPVPKDCITACLRNWVPVCGTDGVTYGNQCQMDAFRCTKNVNVFIAHEGEC